MVLSPAQTCSLDLYHPQRSPYVIRNLSLGCGVNTPVPGREEEAKLTNWAVAVPWLVAPSHQTDASVLKHKNHLTFYTCSQVYAYDLC